MKKIEIINHTADIGIKVKGNSLKEVFENLALGMFEIMVQNRNSPLFSFEKRGTVPDKIEITSPDIESLAHDWLSELLYIFNTKHKIFKKFKINDISKVNNSFKLEGEAIGEMFNPEVHTIKREIKAVTYHNLKVKRGRSYFCCEVIFDI